MSALSQIGAAGRWLLHARHGVAAIAQTVATRFLLAAINVCTGIITVRSLGAVGRGEQAAMALWPALLSYLLTLGIPSAVRYCIRREPERSNEYFTIAMIMATVLSFVTFGAGLIFIPVWLHAYSPDVVRGAQILMLFAPEVMVSLILTAMLETLGEFTLANSTRYVPALITLVALSALAISHTMTPFLSAASYLAPPVVTAFWIGWKLRRSFTLRIFDMRPGLRVLSSYGLRSYGVDILATLSTQIDQVLVIGILSATNMGVYVVALNTSRVLQLLHQAVVTVVLPSAAGLEKERVVAMVGRATRVSTLIGAVFAVVLIALFPLLIPLFYGSEFGVAVRVAQVLTIEALLGGLIFVLAQTFMALGRPGLVTALQGFGLVVAVPCMFLLMPRLGLMGAALALLISTGCRLIFLFVCFPLVLHVPVPSIVPVGADFASLRRGLKSQA